MESDWEVELGGDAPVIDACWAGFVDLRIAPERTAQLPEAARLPALGEALVSLNAPSSPIWTAKCDVWVMDVADPDQFDADELDAPSEFASHALACYIDLLPKSDEQWTIPEFAARDCKYLCSRLREIPLRCCRADLVIRRARIIPTLEDLGITAYLTACGPTADDAVRVLSVALTGLADSILTASPPTAAPSKLQ